MKMKRKPSKSTVNFINWQYFAINITKRWAAGGIVWGKTQLAEWVDKAQITGTLVISFSYQFFNELMN